MTIIELPDEQAAALKAKANAPGLSLEAWLQQLAAEQEAPPSRPHRHIADVICENMQDVPPELHFDADDAHARADRGAHQ